MDFQDEFSEGFYVKEFLTNYASLLANIIDNLPKEKQLSISSLSNLDKKARNVLDLKSYKNYKKKRERLTRSFNEKLANKITKENIQDSITEAQNTIKKYNL